MNVMAINYIIYLSFNGDAFDKNVTIIKALRELFGLTLREAKEINDNHMIPQLDGVSDTRSFKVNAGQYARARYVIDNRPPTFQNDGSEYTQNVFYYDRSEEATQHDWKDISEMSSQ
jgi:hypothetical protein